MRFIIALLALTVGLAGCTNPAAKPTPKDGKLKVVTTTGMLADAVRNIGGNNVEVTALMGPGVDPHLYKATAGDIERLQSAHLVVTNGLELEGRMAEILGKLESQGIATYAAAEESLTESGKLLDSGLGHPDPHVWFDISLWSDVLKGIAGKMTKMRPDLGPQIADNTRKYQEELGVLDNEVKEAIATVPETQRVLITAHDAFHYFGRRYGFEVLGIQGTSTATEAGISTIRSLAETIAKRKVPAIFVESSVPQATVQALQKAAQDRGQAVKIGGTLFSDAMGAEGTSEGTYIGMVRANVRTIVQALQ